MGEVVNLNDLALVLDRDDPEGYRVGAAALHSLVGAERLRANVFELPPGEAVCPYHYEYPDEEWLVVLEGTPTVRRPDGERVLVAGDVVCFPAGPEGAHKVTNRSSERARVLIFSDHASTGVAIYPDSNKIGVSTGNEHDKILVKRESGVGYYEGETDAAG